MTELEQLDEHSSCINDLRFRLHEALENNLTIPKDVHELLKRAVGLTVDSE